MIRRLLATSVFLGALYWVAPLAVVAQAQDDARGRPSVSTQPHADGASDTARDTAKPTPDQTTHHVLELPGRTLKFAATAGAIRLSNDENAPQTDVAFVAYQLEDADRHTRPVAFVFNGGPGAS